MTVQTYSPITSEYTLTCDECGHTASDPTLPWLTRWFNQNHKVCN